MDYDPFKDLGAGVPRRRWSPNLLVVDPKLNIGSVRSWSRSPGAQLG